MKAPLYIWWAPYFMPEVGFLSPLNPQSKANALEENMPTKCGPFLVD